MLETINEFAKMSDFWLLVEFIMRLFFYILVPTFFVLTNRWLLSLQDQINEMRWRREDN